MHEHIPLCTLLQDFALATGLTPETTPRPQALESHLALALDGFELLIAPDPRTPERLSMELSWGPLELVLPESEQASEQVRWLAMLHQLNHAARLEHDWQLSLSPAGDWLLHTQRDIHRTTVQDLQALVEDALSRAQAMVALEKAHRALSTPAPGQDLSPAPPPLVAHFNPSAIRA